MRADFFVGARLGRYNPAMTAPDTQNQTITLTVAEADTGTRADRYIAANVPELTRSRVQALIRAGDVSTSHGVMTDVGHKLKAPDTLTIVVPPPAPAVPRGEDIALTVVYEDKDVIVIDKPAGLVVHPAPGHAEGTLVNALIAHCGDSLSGIGGVRRPGIVHRLDKDTSGLLVVAKTDVAHQSLADQFASHGADGRLQRTYQAIVWGTPTRPAGVIEAHLARSTHNRTKMTVTRPTLGREATTHYEVAEVFTDAEGKPLASLMRFHLETGRTHQIRVHAAHIGHPVLGDQTYGTGFKTSASRLPDAARAALDALDRQALHAAELGFAHPRTGKQLHFVSELPVDMAALREALQNRTPPKRTKAQKAKKA